MDGIKEACLDSSTLPNFFYCIGKPGVQPEYPTPTGPCWAAQIKTLEERWNRTTEARPSISAEQQDASDNGGSSQVKRRRLNSGDSEGGLQHDEEDDLTNDEEQESEELGSDNGTADFTGNPINGPRNPFWESTDARKLFGAQKHEDGKTWMEDALDGLDRKIEKLQKVNQTQEGWRNVVEGRDPENKCSEFQIMVIRQRSAILCKAYLLANFHLGCVPRTVEWEQCCQLACDELNECGLTSITSRTTLMRWNCIFRDQECFPNPSADAQAREPPLFKAFPTAKKLLIKFCVKNLRCLSTALARAHMLEKIPPVVFELWKKKTKGEVPIEDASKRRRNRRH